MGISKISRLVVFALKSVEQDVLAEIQALGAVHLESADELLGELAGGAAPQGGDSARKLGAVETAIAALDPYKERVPLRVRLTTERRRLTVDELRKAQEDSRAASLSQEVNSILEGRTRLAREEATLLSQIEALEPWGAVAEPIAAVASPTPDTAGLFVALPEDQADALADLGDDVACQVVGSSDDTTRALVVAWNDRADDVRRRLADIGAELVALPRTEAPPADEIKTQRDRIGEIAREREELGARLKDLAGRIGDLELYRDYLAFLVQQQESMAFLAGTERVSVLTGYVPEDCRDTLEKQFEKFGTSAHVTFAEPGDDEDSPVLLANGDVVQSFEIVTNIFGLPGRTEFDPTPLLTPFFALFFAVALTDAGYGLFLAIVTFCVMRFLKVAPFIKSFMRMMFISGCMTIVLGIVTGGYFGIQTDKLPDLARDLIIINPMAEPSKFLAFALGLGFFQMWLGMFLSFYKHCRTDSLWAAICLDLPWILLMPGAAIWFLGKNLPGPARNGLLIVAAAMIVLLTGYGNKNVLKRLGIGAYALYGGIGLLGDLLSYSRLMAFGLATAGIGMVVNQLSAMLGKVPVIGWLLAIVLLVVGHLFNLVINAFGGWIHTARLQFIEFFGRFYEGGGRPFVPLAARTKYVDIKV